MMVRPATCADIPAMMLLANHSVTAAHWPREHYERIFDDHASRRLALVIGESVAAQGFLIAQEVASEWEIENIAISGAARRRGLGTRLLGEFLNRVRAEGAAAVYLEVRESNQAARSLYEKWGFVESGRRRGYYSQPGEDAIIYRFSFS